MRQVRKAIIAGFVGATIWAFSAFVAVSAGNYDFVRLAASTNSGNAFDDAVADPKLRERRLTLFYALRDEVVIITVAGVAWLLTPLLKSKNDA